MKKISIILLFVSSIMLCGCSDKNNMKLDTPWSISYEEKALSYYDTSDTIEDAFSDFEIVNINTLPFNFNGDTIVVNDNKNIRAISIISEDVTTYPNIHVGDKIGSVKDTFSYEISSTKTTYSVLFNESEEVNPSETKNEDGWVWINYTVDDSDIITQIVICDTKYGKKLQ